MNEQVLKYHLGHLEKIVREQFSEIEKVKHKCSSLNVAGKISKVEKDEKTVKDAEDEVEDGVAKIDAKEAIKTEIENENEKEPEKDVENANVDSSKMNLKADEDSADPNLDDQVSKMLVDESDAASEIDPIKFVNIRQRVKSSRKRNKESSTNASMRISKILREKASSLVGTTTEDDNMVDLDHLVEQVVVVVTGIVEQFYGVERFVPGSGKNSVMQSVVWK